MMDCILRIYYKDMNRVEEHPVSQRLVTSGYPDLGISDHSSELRTVRFPSQ
jgi:hypothetical protein